VLLWKEKKKQRRNPIFTPHSHVNCALKCAEMGLQVS